jgi:tetratricopeptide (TPR) repeat protein
MTNSRQTLLASGLLALVTLATYWPVIHDQFIGYDDAVYVTENTWVKSGLNRHSVAWAFTTGESANWHPLTWLSHELDVQLFGLNPAAHHLVNLLFHVTNVILLLLVMTRMTGRLWPSAFAAALFALHPLHVESVAWAAERKDVLSTFFLCLTLLAYERYVRAKWDGMGSGLPAYVFYLSALACFALGLLAKSMLVTLPCLLLLLDHWPLRRFQIAKSLAPAPRSGAGPAEKPGTQNKNKIRDVKGPGFGALLVEKLPFFGLVIVISLATYHAQHQAGTVAEVQDCSISGRVANALASYLKYLGKTFWPTDLAIFYPHPAIVHSGLSQWPAWQIAAAALALVGISVLAVLRLGRQPWFATGWFWYLGTLVPVIGFVQVGSQAMADRYTYIPLIGIFVILAWTLAEILPARPLARFSQVGISFAVLVILACAALTRHQVGYWRNDFTLFEHALAVNEGNAPAHTVIAVAYARQGKFGFALAHARAATYAEPGYSGAWYALGDVYDSLGRPQDALRSFQTALRLNPNVIQTWFRLGCIQTGLHQLDEAVQSYRAALRLNPEFAAAHNNLGSTLWTLGQRKEAIQEFVEAVRLNPTAPEKHYNLGTALSDNGQPSEAAKEFAEAIRLKPDYADAHAALGVALVKAGQFADALKEFQIVVQLRPTDAGDRLRLGGAFLVSGQTNEAATAFAEAQRLQPGLASQTLAAANDSIKQGQLDDALRGFTTVTWLEPGNAQAHEQLGLLLARRAKFGEAIFHLQEALRLAPGAEAHYNLAAVLAMHGDLREAIEHYRQVLLAKPDSAPTLNDLAWILATAPQSDLRNGSEAVRLAERACQLTNRKNPHFLGTLDAAYAESGQFDQAITAASTARDLALASGDKSVAEAAETRVSLYRAGKPYRQ